MSSYYFKQKSMKSLLFKRMLDGQPHILQINMSLYFHKLLFKVKNTDVRLNKMLKLKFKLLLSICHVLPTL